MASGPLARTIGIKVWGTRRANPDGALLTAIGDLCPAPRAAACRTAGQLGRTDLTPQIAAHLTDPDPTCQFRAAWASARLGNAASHPVLAGIALEGGRHAQAALDILLRRLDPSAAHDFLSTLAKTPERQRDLIRGAGTIGDPAYIPWLIGLMDTPETARLAGESFSTITGVDMAYRDLDRRAPEDFESGPNDDPADENVALDEDDRLPWPDPPKVKAWWDKNRARFSPGTPYIVGMPKSSADYLRILSDAYQRQRAAAALELAIRNPNKTMFEVRARGRLQRAALARAMQSTS